MEMVPADYAVTGTMHSPQQVMGGVVPCLAVTKSGSLVTADDVDFGIPPHPWWGREEVKDITGFGDA